MKISLPAKAFWAFVTTFTIGIASATAADLDKVLAVVNNEAITLSEYQTRHKRQQLLASKTLTAVPEEIDINILRTLIDERLQAQVAVSRGIRITDQEVESTLRQMAAQNDISVDELLTELDNQGISPAQFRRSVSDQRLIQRVIDLSVNSRVTVSEQEIDFHLQAHKELYTPNEAYEVSHLYISSAEKSESEMQAIIDNINEIRVSLSSGLDFAEAVKQYSNGDNIEGGGYMGWRKEDQLPELFLNALRKTSIGDVSETLQSANGYHLLKLHAKEGDIKIVTQHLIRHILIQPLSRDITPEEAVEFLNDLKHQLTQNADFSQLARLHSDDDSSALNGGDLGWVNPGDAAPAIENIAGALPLKQVSDPIRSRFGYHLVEVLDRRKKDITLDLARKSAEREVFKRKAAEFYESWFDRIRGNAYIEYMAAN